MTDLINGEGVALGLGGGHLNRLVSALGGPGASAHVEALPAFLGATNPAVVPRPDDAETLPGELRETATGSAAVEALRDAVDRSNVERKESAAAAAWHAEAVVRTPRQGEKGLLSHTDD